MMDPDANLIELRSLIVRLDSPYFAHAEDRDARVKRMCELFEALDNWILGGGFLPADWERTRRSLEGGRS